MMTKYSESGRFAGVEFNGARLNSRLHMLWEESNRFGRVKWENSATN